MDEEEEPVPFVKIAIERETFPPEIIQSDEQGSFTYQTEKATNVKATFYAIGYQKEQQTFSFHKDTSLLITLKPVSKNLGELQIIDRRPILERRPDRIIFRTKDNIQTSGGNGLEILQKIPGVHVEEQDISLIGRGSLHISLNGRPVHLSGKALADYLSGFSAEQIEQIEVISNPSSGMDAEGSAGIVNIKTAQTKQRGWSGSISGMAKRFFYNDQPIYDGVKHYGDLDGGANLFYTTKKASFYTNATYTQGREIWGYGIGVEYPDILWDMGDSGAYKIKTLNLIAGTDYQLNANTRIGFEYQYGCHLEDGADYVQVPIYSPSHVLDSSIRTVATYFPIAKSNGFNFHLEQKLNDRGAKMMFHADYFNFFRTDWSDLDSKSLYPTRQPKPNKGLTLTDTAKQNIKIYTLKADFTYPTSFAQIGFGGKLSFIDTYSNIFYYEKAGEDLAFQKDISNEFRYIENTQALYFNLSKEMPDWNFEGGLRAEITQIKAESYFDLSRVRSNQIKVFPSLLVQRTLNSENHLSFSFNKRIQRPTFWNLNPYKTFMTPFTYVEGNPYLRPAYTLNTEISHVYKNRFHTSLYFQRMNNGFDEVIEPQSTGPYRHITRMKNFFDLYRWGIQETVTLRPQSWWETDNTAQFYYSRSTSSIADIEEVSGFSGYLESNHTFYFNKGKTFNGHLGFWYQFPQVYTFNKSNSYSNVDLGLQLKTVQNRLTFSLFYTDLFKTSASKRRAVVKQLRTTFTRFQLNSHLRLSAVWTFGGNEKNVSTTGNEKERERIN